MESQREKIKKVKKIANKTLRKTNEQLQKIGAQTGEWVEETSEDLKPILKEGFEQTKKVAFSATKKTGQKIGELSNQTIEAIKADKERRTKSKNDLETAQKKTEHAVKQTNEKIEVLGDYTKELYDCLIRIQVIFDMVRHMPSDLKLELDELAEVRIDWKNQVDKIEKDFQLATKKGAGIGALGTGAGLAVGALGPSVAMGIATTFGVASTGTAISALTGAAAKSAALAWLGGGALTAGGGGMIAGKALLALTGPVGWAVAGIALLSGGGLFLKARNEKEQLENIFTLISIRDTKSYHLAIVELNERITRIKNETNLLENAIESIRDFGLDYEQMTNQQQYNLGTYVNLMNSSTQLLVNPILGLQPKYSQQDFIAYTQTNSSTMKAGETVQLAEAIVFLSNLLYKIDLDEKDKKVIWKAICSNEELLKSMNLEKRDFKQSIMDQVEQALTYKYEMSDVN